MRSFAQGLFFSIGLTCLALTGGCGSSGTSAASLKPLPAAVNAFVVTSPDTSVTTQLYASTIDNETLTFSVQSGPSHGTVALDQASGVLTYTPKTGYVGGDSLTYVATGVNGDSDPATVTIYVNPNPPLVSTFGAGVYVHNGSPASVDFVVRLQNPPNGQATVNYTTVDGTATAGTDYTAESGTLIFGAGVESQTVSVPLSDLEHQYSRYFYLQLSTPSSNLTLGVKTAAAILRYYPEPLNDTGVTGCATSNNGNPSNPDTCPQSDYPMQDADLGRDAAYSAGTLVKVGAGIFGYDFTLIGNDGTPLFNQQSASFGTEPWACVLDNWTGLEWEVPTAVANQGLFDTSYIYTWYNPDSSTNGGGAGERKSGSFKQDTNSFVQAVNQAGLCGHNDWRLPTAEEFRNLVNIGAPGSPNGPLPSIPTLEGAGYWTATSGSGGGRAVVISTLYGYDSFLPKNTLHYALLVRGGGS